MKYNDLCWIDLNIYSEIYFSERPKRNKNKQTTHNQNTNDCQSIGCNNQRVTERTETKRERRCPMISIFCKWSENPNDLCIDLFGFRFWRSHSGLRECAIDDRSSHRRCVDIIHNNKNEDDQTRDGRQWKWTEWDKIWYGNILSFAFSRLFVSVSHFQVGECENTLTQSRPIDRSVCGLWITNWQLQWNMIVNLYAQISDVFGWMNVCVCCPPCKCIDTRFTHHFSTKPMIVMMRHRFTNKWQNKNKMHKMINNSGSCVCYRSIFSLENGKVHWREARFVVCWFSRRDCRQIFRGVAKWTSFWILE